MGGTTVSIIATSERSEPGRPRPRPCLFSADRSLSTTIARNSSRRDVARHTFTVNRKPSLTGGPAVPKILISQKVNLPVRYSAARTSAITAFYSP
jgi:hypothetical protein